MILMLTLNNAIKLNGLIFDINPTEICSQIESDNLSNWCKTIQTEMRMAMKQEPFAQPERKTGRWIRNDNGTYSCSICHSWIPEEQHCYARYCLYCGADMKGDEERRIDE